MFQPSNNENAIIKPESKPSEIKLQVLHSRNKENNNNDEKIYRRKKDIGFHPCNSGTSSPSVV